MQSDTIPHLWQTTFQSITPENYFAFRTQNSKITHQLSYKELNAKAHCLTAYFLFQPHFNKSKPVFIISNESLEYFTIDLGCALIGMPHFSLNQNVSYDKLKYFITKLQPHYFFIQSYETYLHLKPCILEYSNQLEVIIFEENYKNINEDEPVKTFETLIESGKILWRENQNAIISAKNSVKPNAKYCYPNESFAISHETFVKDIAILSNLTQRLSSTINFATEPLPYHPFIKIAGYFLPLFSKNKIFLTKDLKEVKNIPITSFIASQDFINSLQNQIQNQSNSFLYKKSILSANQFYNNKFSKKSNNFSTKLLKPLTSPFRYFTKRNLHKHLKFFFSLQDGTSNVDPVFWFALNLHCLQFVLQKDGTIFPLNDIGNFVPIPKPIFQSDTCFQCPEWT